ncbi:hypothetical protein BGP77_14445 [Saccharospirillum sp. MSK14-1]|uniref:DsbA family protein n=1 Tax=Saccharospirillum sp. MSK14-1 TaxID=1897632 RepID=UPI000D40B649|nr:DsbA family protein [Saccharospirillum sp. MSK14-1]PTY37681.1 hypothetical protein BGP77_14445 [Saccharospirillum sp. MSK14-1]
MKRLRLTLLSFVPAILLSGFAAAESPTQAEIEQMLHDYLMAHPEVIQQSLDRYEQQQAAARQAAEQERLMALTDQLEASDNDPVIGNPNGSVTLVEFYDYNCGYCKRADSTVQALIDANPDLRVVYKEFPILAETSLTAAQASLALHSLYPAQFEDFHRNLLGRRSLPSHDAVWDAIDDMDGVDVDAVREESQADWIQQTLAENRQLARALGISGTPTFVVGGQLLKGAYPQATIQAAIDDAS